ncbi:carbamoyl phosphate synthase small subunit [Bacillus daqingensis]|uniref:Carbamoyl phosphate synthase small chain n=1 Tax=Bacillus daqingensis TaxID=872396 RepID=A0ABV9NRL8_9BACI
MMRKLVLENGAVFKGKALGSDRAGQGEVVFNTSMTGYQEIVTDPSYRDQIICMTYPLIGNYGINRDDFENIIPHCAGMIVKKAAANPSHFRQERTLDEWLHHHNIPGIQGIDTRKLTRIIRTGGTMRGVLSDSAESVEEAQIRAAAVHSSDQVRQVSASQQYWYPGRGRHRIVLIDYGAKKGIISHLLQQEFEVISVPWNTTAEDVLSLSPDGVMLSNGPGDPQDIPEAVQHVRKLADVLPVFGICLGHQLLALAFGADTEKMTFGHRGGNHPVRHLESGRVAITSQNHSYTVRKASLSGTGLHVSHVNVNDGSIEGLKHETLPVFSVQYHPEAAPGPTESAILFDQFKALVHEQTGGTIHA